MMSAYVIVIAASITGDSSRVIGPFDTAAQASGRAFEIFGALNFGSRKWNVLKMESPEEGRP